LALLILINLGIKAKFFFADQIPVFDPPFIYSQPDSLFVDVNCKLKIELKKIGG
jgi:hypothetical protein